MCVLRGRTGAVGVSSASEPVPTRWVRLAPLAVVVRSAAYLLPALAVLAAIALLSAALPNGVTSTARLTALALAALAALALGTYTARRLLPLSFLLGLDLLFEDELPSRFGLALRSGSTRRLADLRPDGATEAARTIAMLAAAIAAHDRHTRNHSERVRAYTDLIAEQMGIDEDARARLRWAALLHDVGKLGVPRQVINKAGPLDEHEWATVRLHPYEGDRLIAPLRPFLGPWADTTLHHHERWDGAGYPQRLAAEDVGLGARIVAVADAYEVMTSVRRIYSVERSPAQARRELADHAGAQFDPAVVRAFLEVPLARLRRIAGWWAWIVGGLAAPGLTASASAGSAPLATPGPPVGAHPPEVGVPAGEPPIGDHDLDADDLAAEER